MMRNAFRPSQARRTLRGMVMPCMPDPIMLQAPALPSHTLVVPNGEYAGEHTVFGTVPAIDAWRFHLDDTNDIITTFGTRAETALRERNAALADAASLRDHVALLESAAAEAATSYATAGQAELEKVKGELYAAEEKLAEFKDVRYFDLGEGGIISGDDHAIGRVSELAQNERRIGAENRSLKFENEGLQEQLKQASRAHNSSMGRELASLERIKTLEASVAARKPAVTPADANPRAPAGNPSPVGERPALSEATATVSKNILDMSRAGFSIEEVTRRINARLSPDQWLKVAVVEIIRELAEASI